MPHPPPLLLTRRLTVFLHANISSQLETALIITPSGKLIAHASPQPVTALRTKCTVAASLWAIQATPSVIDTTSSSSPSPSSPSITTAADALPLRDPAIQASASARPRPSTMTVQLSGGTVILRRLRCGLLFVCMGPGPGNSPKAAAGSGQDQQSQQHQDPQTLLLPQNARGAGESEPVAPWSSAPAVPPNPREAGQPVAVSSPAVGSPSEAESILSTGTGAATTASYASAHSAAALSAAALRRQVDHLAHWLDDKLGTLTVPDEGIGLGTS